MSFALSQCTCTILLPSHAGLCLSWKSDFRFAGAGKPCAGGQPARLTQVPSRSVRVNALFGIGKGKTKSVNCGECKGKGAVTCSGCKGTGRNKKNGNMFERWKCFDCQGFGLVSCPNCGTGGLTPEQRGER